MTWKMGAPREKKLILGAPQRLGRCSRKQFKLFHIEIWCDKCRLEGDDSFLGLTTLCGVRFSHDTQIWHTHTPHGTGTVDLPRVEIIGLRRRKR